ncbi:MAG: AAA family ATPase [Nitrospirae bacterium]|nr:AAA family ATPase [Nitrospirota bacterium]
MNIKTEEDIEFNRQFTHAFNTIEQTSQNVFITGRAGTGKSTLLQYFREKTKKNIAVLASTGVAAVNVKGQTLHSFFNFRADVTPDTAAKIKPRNKEIYKKLDAIVIDEISMVRADLLDCADIFLRRHGRKKKLPFGGIQMIFIGDLYQLPPVVTSKEKNLFSDYYKSPYFFSARVFDHDLFSGAGAKSAPFEMAFIELEKVYRQRDQGFLDILNRIRNNTVTEADMGELNARCDPSFAENPGDFYIHLTTTNALAEKVNMMKLSELKAEAHEYHGVIEGGFEGRNLPTSQVLTIKKGSQVMLLNNDPHGRWINGTIGLVEEIEEGEDAPDILWVKLPDGETADIMPYKWEMFEFSYDKKMSRIFSESIGSFIQYPLRLAWAVTIHKCQGMTFDKVVIDIGAGTFSHGQLYVALSRCTGIKGLVLKKAVTKKNVLLDWRVVNFVTRYQYMQAEKTIPMDERLAVITDAIKRKKRLEIIYLKAKDEKSARTVIPLNAGEMEYNGRKFPGLRAFCTSRKGERVFNIEKILGMSIVE